MMKLENKITPTIIFGAGALTGYFAHNFDYKTFEPVINTITDPAFLGILLITAPFPIGAGMLHYIGKRLEEQRKNKLDNYDDPYDEPIRK